MSLKQDEFLHRLQSAFRAEAEEHLQTMSTGLLELEHAPDAPRRQEIVSGIFREAHSLKGAARAVNAAEVESICQSLESVFADWKHTDRDLSPDSFDPVQDAVTQMGQLLDPPTASEGLIRPEVAQILNRLARLKSDGDPTTFIDSPAAGIAEKDRTSPLSAAPPPAAPVRQETQESLPTKARLSVTPKSVAAETLRISAAKLDALLLRAEEMLSVKLTSNQHHKELRQAADALDEWEKEWGKVSAEAKILPQRAGGGENGRSAAQLFSPSAGISGSVNLREFLEWNEAFVHTLTTRLRSLTTAADHARRSAGTLIDSLLEDAKKLLMLPFSTLFEVFPKLVRDLSRDQGKQVELVIQGSEVEIDKRILEEMKDPLIHLLRNCVDHGIEGSEARKTAGKPAHGMVSISVSQVDGNKVEIRVADDGAGINRRRVFEAAAKLGISGHRIGSDGSERNALDLIFLPEVSTTPIITEISGRGIGLSIVQEKVERLGGQVLVESTEGVGTTFRMLLPLTLATFRGILVHAADQVFVVPTSSVERVVRVQPQQIRTFESRKAIEVDGKAVSLARLADVLELPARPASGGTDGAFVQVIVVSAGDQRIGFSVDAVLNEQEVLVKRLGKPLLRVRNIAGATVLGSGKPVAILNPADLVKSAIRQGGRSASASAASEKIAPGKAKRKSILVAEDSITARTLLKSILESSGYEVKTAVDGAEALTILKTTDFDAVISDVEMPRLNGFDLTSRIRADKRLAQLPVVLVTALASPEDRERGVDAGANAYIVKSSFDQSNLLEVIARLT